jgi:hypothetical protein
MRSGAMPASVGSWAPVMTTGSESRESGLTAREAFAARMANAHQAGSVG